MNNILWKTWKIQGIATYTRQDFFHHPLLDVIEFPISTSRSKRNFWKLSFPSKGKPFKGRELVKPIRERCS